MFDAMQEDVRSVTLRALLADGGATRNDQLMQFQADVLDCAVIAKLLAGGVPAWERDFWRAWDRGVLVGPGGDRRSCPEQFDRFEPRMPESRRAELYGGWQAAVARAKS